MKKYRHSRKKGRIFGMLAATVSRAGLVRRNRERNEMRGKQNGYSYPLMPIFIKGRPSEDSGMVSTPC